MDGKVLKMKNNNRKNIWNGKKRKKVNDDSYTKTDLISKEWL